MPFNGSFDVGIKAVMEKKEEWRVVGAGGAGEALRSNKTIESRPQEPNGCKSWRDGQSNRQMNSKGRHGELLGGGAHAPARLLLLQVGERVGERWPAADPSQKIMRGRVRAQALRLRHPACDLGRREMHACRLRAASLRACQCGAGTPAAQACSCQGLPRCCALPLAAAAAGWAWSPACRQEGGRGQGRG